MTTIFKRNKALSVSPLKASATMGAALAFLGIRDAMAMLHGAQGCTAYGKVFLIGHFREPVALQTTAMDQVTTVMGADDNVIEGLAAICKKNRPALIGVPTTGLSETQGSDVNGAVSLFRQQYPEFAGTAVIPVETPDYAGSMETGFAKAMTAMIDRLVPEGAGADPASPRINVLVNSTSSPGDVEELKVLVETFGLEPVILPDLSDSLDGHLDDFDHKALTTGGTGVGDIRRMGKARASIIIGSSLAAAADLLAARTGVPDHRFDHLMGLDAVDGFVDCLRRLSGRPVPDRIRRQRRQLQDAMLDTHFHLAAMSAAIAAEPDLLKGFGDLLAGMGARVCAAVAPVNAPVLSRLACESVKIGDLEDLEAAVFEHGTDIVIGNAHCRAAAERLEKPLLGAGFPQHDRFGAPASVSIGYRGSRRLLFDMANLLLEAEPQAVKPYRSIYASSETRGSA
ncbi:nitrogenase iron-molybdenum cofactor biosynthesis protein NifN [Martelella endophytica]|uniref:Nitrogenase iron-molybdenum cofactor biosynthesis protein NifN n=1 Tax=Martelella endophytica TaxID=1486262 RepID=A0A0D5LS28_MAREN|nr:nitrogenase iron-molybdenum cofactor biosynthesis protein NifN [Martelella endophytica]AJY46775.1 nitrogenase iron-molybdenum cofactor biosynthesis protein NifN [Martelella endophytica]